MIFDYCSFAVGGGVGCNDDGVGSGGISVYMSLWGFEWASLLLFLLA